MAVRAPVLARWVWANAWSELIGLGSTLVLGGIVAAALEHQQSPWLIVLGACLFIAKGTLIEGLLVGYAQGRVLRDELPGLSLRGWMAMTALGAAIAWTLGMIPSTLAALHEPGKNEPPAELHPFVFTLAAAGMGAVLGVVLSLPQWFELRRHIGRSAWWMPANAVAWAAGMVMVFAGMATRPERASLAASIVWVGLTCLLAGAAVGVLHGVVLARLLRDHGVRAPSIGSV